MTKLTADQCRVFMLNGEFGSDVKAAAPCVAVILTQSWCSQWAAMRFYLESLTSETVFYVQYDLEDFGDTLMNYKENIIGNDQIPYIRFYRNGELAHQRNFIDKPEFLKLLRD